MTIEFILEGESDEDRNFGLLALADLFEEEGKELAQGLRLIVEAGYRPCPLEGWSCVKAAWRNVDYYSADICAPHTSGILPPDVFDKINKTGSYRAIMPYRSELEAYLDLAYALASLSDLVDDNRKFSHAYPLAL